MTKKKLRVGVLFGGRSGEHEISLLSAASVLRALDPTRYEVIPIGITKEGRWIASGDPLAALSGGALQLAGTEVTLFADPSTPGALNVRGSAEQPALAVDLFLPVLHGPFGEDGSLQGLLELAGVPYVGSGVLASSTGMDKGAMKALFRDAGLPVAPGTVFLRREWESDPDGVRMRCERELGYPLFIKPANMGSSVGISKVRSADELPAAFESACAYDRRILAEAAIQNAREIEVAVLGNDDPVSSVPGEIRPSREFYDYEAKYEDAASELLIPAPLPDEIVKTIGEMSIRCFKALDCAGLARVDFLIRESDNEVFVNEINTMPGFTAISMYPKLWQASGVSYSELLDRLIKLALERHEDRGRNRIDYR
ncbi:MAG: D-alanine--D-alanine ligase A [Gemmatimonadetes bacterium]|nr:D-alanine--D-alanine ligase A [Gemmatimonadota bacterium]